MNNRTPIAVSVAVCLTFASLAASPASADDDTVQTVITLLSDKDKEVRAIGLEQVRDEAKGAEATRRFAALLPKLASEVQVELLGALAGRGDAAAKPAVLELLKSSKGEVRAAAIHALGPLGDKSDVPQLVALLGDATSKKDAVAALMQLHGDGVNAALCEQLKFAAPAARIAVAKLLVARHAVDSVPALVTASKDKDAKVRAAALEALGQLAGPELISKLAREILDAKDDKSREEAEISLASIARRDPKNTDPAVPLLKIMDGMSEREKTALLPALGRVGGPSAKKVLLKAMFEADPAKIPTAIKSLCNWPDGGVAQLMVSAIGSLRGAPAEQKELVDALIRVAPLPDGRPDAERLAMLKKAMELSSTDAQRTTVIKRARAIRSLDTLRFVAPYMDQPQFSQIACETVVELAHHKELRQPNKAEFGKALDKVILLSKDPEVILRAKHYLKDETWVEKQLKGK
jgi:HEAT repeat protein